MSEKAGVYIDIEAAKALVYWKSLFADEVAMRARQLAAESSRPDQVTLAHMVRHAVCDPLTAGLDPQGRGTR